MVEYAKSSAFPRRGFLLAAICSLSVLLFSASAPAQTQADGPAGVTAAAKKKEKGKGGKRKRPSKGAKARRGLIGLAMAIRRSRALPPARRAALSRRALSARRLLRPKRACLAYKRLYGVQRVLSRAARSTRGARRRALLRLEARTTRTRILVFALRPAGKGCGGPATFSIDPSAKPDRRSLPKLGGRRRPLARVVGSDGSSVDFVADEILVRAKARKQLRRILRRHGGKILARSRLPGKRGSVYLVRIARGSNPGGLPADVRRLSKTRGTSTLVSSAEGLSTLAAAADEATHGAAVGVNWVGQGGGFADGFGHDAATGPANFNVSPGPWSDNPYNWVHLAGGGPQDTGVAPAWTLLAKLERLNPSSIRLGILDMGFAPGTNGDFQPDRIAISNVPGVGALGSSNLLSCSGGNPCPWHGTGVHNAAMGIADNRAGAAGPAGPVARPVLVFTLYDFFTGISATSAAAAAGAKVINMSYGADVPAVLSWSAAPFEATTAALRAAGILFFAAAGNGTTDVDATDCFIVCWEETLHTPCENVGVICVGASNWGGLDPACYSNWGREGVDIWAPGTLPVGPDPEKGSVHGVSGTSVASPFAAGVAALAWAGEPAARAGAVERALLSHTRPGGTTETDCAGEPAPRRTLDRFIDAEETVKDLLPPDVEIRRPADGASYQRGSPVPFEGFVYDDGRGPASLSWTLDGGTTFGTAASFSERFLPVGTHDVEFAANFADGSRETDRIRLTITNNAPSVDIVAPAAGAAFFQSQTVTFRGQSVDVNEPGGVLADSQVSWSLDGGPFASGHEAMRAMSDLSVGPHTVAFRGDDGLAVAEDSITINVEATPLDKPPTVHIDSPTGTPTLLADQSDSGGFFKSVKFETTASDAEADPLTYEWLDSINGGPPQLLSTTLADPTLKLYWVDTGSCFNTTKHDVTVKVSDATSTVSDTARVFISLLC